MTNSLCHTHTKSLLPRKEYCVICLLEERYALRDELVDLVRAMALLLDQIEDLLVLGEHETAVEKAKALLEEIHGTPLPDREDEK